MFSTPSRRRRATIPTSVLALLAAPLALVAAPAQAASTGLVITEVYGAGGNAGADLNADFVELKNISGSPISLDSLSLQYRSSGGSGAANGVADLSGTVPAGEHFLVQTSPEADPDGAELGPADLVVTGVNMGGTAGTVWLADTQVSMTLPTASVINAPDVIDLVGFGGTNTFEVAPTAAPSTTTSVRRTDETVDGDNNAADFTAGDQTPASCSTCGTPPPSGGEATIAEIQGAGDTSPLAGETVTTRGVVTAAYPTGDFYAFVIQTPGTGAGHDETPGRSDALWVFQASDGVDAEPGTYVEVTGAVSERFGRTQLTYDPDVPLTVLDEPADVTPLETSWWPTDAEREAHESELVDLSGQGFTVTDNYSTNRFGEVGLATGDRPLVTPTEVANPTLDPTGHAAAVADNAARGVVLDDGSDWDYQNDDFAQDEPLPWIDRDTTARVGAAATVTAPVIVDFGFGAWRLQPTSQVNGTAPELVSFEDTRADNQRPQDVGGDLTVATFNVLNYFNTTGRDWVDSGRGTCTYYFDRDDDPVTDNRCEPDGPRGAAEDEDLQRQQDKIVAAINTLDASVVSLEEIENSAALGEADRDDALAELTGALNAAAGTERWAYVPSPPPAQRPASEDVIRTAFIYDPSVVETVGDSVIHDDPAFSNARQPLAQAFVPVGATDTARDAFAVIVNHFKSKGSACAGEPDGPQGNCNQSRIAQARSLAAFADGFADARGLEQVFLTGDFNSYSEEDPMVVLERAGFTQLASDTPDEWSYSFDGTSGSLDHVLANDAALDEVDGVDIWEINANEAIAYEYSRVNYNVTDFYAADVFRASDHNPELVGVDVRDESTVDLVLSPSQVKQKKETSTATVTVTGADAEPTGEVRFLVDGVPVGSRSLLGGETSLRLGPFTTGTYEVTVDYLGDDDNLPASDTASLVVGNGRG